MPQLSHILYLAYHSTIIDKEKEKIVRVVNIWVTKLFIAETVGDVLINGMKGNDNGKIEPERPSYQSPYPQNLPPPNMSQQQQQQMQQQQMQLPIYQQQQQLPPPPQQQQQQQYNQNQAPPMQVAPSLPFPSPILALPPQMPLFRPPPSFAPGQAAGVLGPPSLPPQFMFPPGAILQQQQHMHSSQQAPSFPSFLNPSFTNPQTQLPPSQQQQQLQQQQPPAQPQQINQFGTFSQQAASIGFNQPTNYSSLQYPPQMMPSVSLSLSTPVLDLHKISVGTMANLVKAAIKAGHPRYVPLDGSKDHSDLYSIV